LLTGEAAKVATLTGEATSSKTLSIGKDMQDATSSKTLSIGKDMQDATSSKTLSIGKDMQDATSSKTLSIGKDMQDAGKWTLADYANVLTTDAAKWLVTLGAARRQGRSEDGEGG